MKSGTRNYMITLLCWIVVAQARTTDVSNFTLDFISVCNGVFDDKEQVESEEQKRDSIQSTMIPVNIPELGGPAFYLDERLNGEVYRQQVQVVTGERNGYIYLTPYNVTDSSRPGSGNVNPADLENLKAEDFQVDDPSCVIVFEEVVPGVYTGTWPDCRATVNMRRPVYGLTISCDCLRVAIQMDMKETYRDGPYVLSRKGDRFPAINLPANYVGPCDRKQ